MNKFAVSVLVVVAFAGLAIANPIPEGNGTTIEPLSEGAQEIPVHPEGFVLSSANETSKFSLEEDDQFLNNEEYSQFALVPTEDEETKYLKGANSLLFKDFCVGARDDTIVFMKGSLNTVASRVFNIMFNSINEIGIEALEANKKAIAEGIEAIQSGKTQAEPKIAEPHNEAEIKENLAEAKEEAQQGVGLWGLIANASKAAVTAVVNTIASETMTRIALLKQEFNGESIPGHINDACATLSFKLKGQLEGKLRETVRELQRADKENQFVEALRAARVENVGCVTTGRIVKAAALCDFMRIAGPTLYPFLGL